MNVRRCDCCGEIRPVRADWFFVALGKEAAFDELLGGTKHWCPECMATVNEFLAGLGAG
jgi:hypothetical protein